MAEAAAAVSRTSRPRIRDREEMEPQARRQVDALWDRQLNDGSRPSLVQKAYDIGPSTPVRG
ncbi:hypothetical protein [Streptomyces sp. NPDC088258]|uniref:hypothetical protein n=1 Tax=Streptomyces sp. NPDC088258 TaxID=3365849 RepID=UPI0038305199